MKLSSFIIIPAIMIGSLAFGATKLNALKAHLAPGKGQTQHGLSNQQNRFSGNYIIKGTVDEKYDTPLKVYLIDNKSIRDSCVLNKGSFVLKGKLDEPFRGHIILQHDGTESVRKRGKKDNMELWVEAGETTVKGQDRISKAVVSGSQLNDDVVSYDKALEPVTAKEQLVQDTMVKNYDKDPLEANKHYDEGMRKLLPERTKLIMQFINGHSDSFFCLDVISSYLDNSPDIAVVERMFSSLSADLKDTPTGKATSIIIANKKTVAIGAQAPVFTQNDTLGKPVNLADFHGKYILIDFWASWCVPCRAENPDVLKAYNKYKNKNFTILGVSLDDERTKAAWIKAIEKDQLPWTQVSDLKGWDDGAAKIYGVRAIPANFLIDPSGKIIAENLHGEALEAALEKYIP
ncbi:TlpA disulfide reductase family protein [Mucilaginibacter sp. L196]|uniref:TlpA disulfide reductase family protein n=1 Tax=Mucilaginibacter sp. L196 TaxID=1641870 RepID=UPI0020B13C52|nr:TlpA disulfide reductase family protein [Mucilaginibacter sp. L196]